MRTHENAQVFAAYDIQSFYFITTRSLVMVTLQCTHHDLSVNDGNAVPDELMHADAVMNELMDGDRYRARYQITDVTRRLNSASRVCDQGRNNVLFSKTGGCIIHHETCRCGWFPREKGAYVLHSCLNESPTEKRVRWTGEPSLGPEC